VAASKDFIVGRSYSSVSGPDKNLADVESSRGMLRKNVSYSKSLNREMSQSESSRYPKNILDALHGIQYIKAKMKEDSHERTVSQLNVVG